MKSVNNSLMIKIIKDDSKPCFGYYIAGSLKDGTAIIGLSLERLNEALKEESTDEVKYILIQTILHEIGHVLEECFDLDFNETEIENIMVHEAKLGLKAK
jgi:predicted Zn-dependent protease